MPNSNEKVGWSGVVRAFDVFSNDYRIVNHPNTPPIDPLSPPNSLDQYGSRQYSLTQIPPNMDREGFVKGLRQRPVWFISCMDRDAVGPAFKALEDRHGRGEVGVIAVAGGVVQPRGIRFDAMSEILEFLSQNADPKLTYLAGHNHGCGLVAKEIGAPLPDKLGVKPASAKENIAMKGLIARRVGMFFDGDSLLGNTRRVPTLACIDRDGGVKLDTNFNDVRPVRLSRFR